MKPNSHPALTLDREMTESANEEVLYHKEEVDMYVTKFE